VVGALFKSLVKLKKTIKQKIAATTENKTTSLLQTLMTEAEAFKNFTGAEKKAIVFAPFDYSATSHSCFFVDCFYPLCYR
jgi:hypothetical protein